jgi:hypothetical protein
MDLIAYYADSMCSLVYGIETKLDKSVFMKINLKVMIYHEINA